MAKSHEETMVFDETRGHLVFLLFCMAQIRVSDGSLGKKAIKSKVEVLDTPISQRSYLM